MMTKKGIMALLFTLVMATNVSAAGVYDGIWASGSPFLNRYYSFNQNGSQLIILSLKTDRSYWSAMTATMSGNAGTGQSLQGFATTNTGFSVIFPTTDTFEVTITSCTPVSEPCSSPAGSVITGHRIF